MIVRYNKNALWHYILEKERHSTYCLAYALLGWGVLGVRQKPAEQVKRSSIAAGILLQAAQSNPTLVSRRAGSSCVMWSYCYQVQLKMPSCTRGFFWLMFWWPNYPQTVLLRIQSNEMSIPKSVFTGAMHIFSIKLVNDRCGPRLTLDHLASIFCFA